MIVRVWGARGSLPTPGADMVRYGGNTSCVQVTLSDGTHIVLDAGTGIRHMPDDLGGNGQRIHLLLTHLHLDHIQGLMFFAPLFRPQSQVTIWGPAMPGSSLKSRIGRYLSAPLTPVEVRELAIAAVGHGRRVRELGRQSRQERVQPRREAGCR